jgi:hypothetical protein
MVNHLLLGPCLLGACHVRIVLIKAELFVFFYQLFDKELTKIIFLCHWPGRNWNMSFTLVSSHRLELGGDLAQGTGLKTHLLTLYGSSLLVALGVNIASLQTKR